MRNQDWIPSRHLIASPSNRPKTQLLGHILKLIMIKIFEKTIKNNNNNQRIPSFEEEALE